MPVYAAIIVPDGEGKYLTLFNKTMDHWAFPGGKLEKDELPIVAAIRELEEETGLVAHGLRLIGSFGHDVKGKLWIGWYFLLESHAQVPAKAKNMLPAKHTDMKYFSHKELVDLNVYPECKAVEMVETDQRSRITFDEYQKQAASTAVYPGQGSLNGLVYCALGLAGEAGEFANKVKKILRGDVAKTGQDEKANMRLKLLYELGDVEWYSAMLAIELNAAFSEVPNRNIQKLAHRKAADTIKGSGDDR